MSEDVFCCVKCWTQYFSCGLCRCFHVYFHNLCFLFSLRFFQITLRFNLKVALQEEIIDECMIFDIHSICVLFYFFCLKLTPVIYIEVYFICLFFNLKEIPVLSCHHWSFCINYESAFLFLILWLLIAFPQTPEITICTWKKLIWTVVWFSGRCSVYIWLWSIWTAWPQLVTKWTASSACCRALGGKGHKGCMWKVTFNYYYIINNWKRKAFTAEQTGNFNFCLISSEWSYWGPPTTQMFKTFEKACFTLWTLLFMHSFLNQLPHTGTDRIQEGVLVWV